VRGKSYFAGSPIMRNLVVTLVALIVADGLISQFLIGNALGYEGNPFLASIAADDRFLLLKLAGGALAAIILWDIHKRRPKLALSFTVLFVALYTGIVFWNLTVFLVTRQ
jgi:hypothetical protein